MATAVNKRIAALLERKDLRQRDIAAETGIAQPTLSRISSGKREPRLDEVMLIAAAAGVGIESILDENPLHERVLVSHRASSGAVETEAVRNKLLSYLEMDAYLATHDIAC